MSAAPGSPPPVCRGRGTRRPAALVMLSLASLAACAAPGGDAHHREMIEGGQVFEAFGAQEAASWRDAHARAMESLRASLARHGWQERSPEEVRDQIAVDGSRDPEHVRECILEGSFRRSRPFVVLLRHATARGSRFSARISWHSRGSAEEIRKQEQSVARFAEQLGVWWAIHDPTRQQPGRG